MFGRRKSEKQPDGPNPTTSKREVDYGRRRFLGTAAGAAALLALDPRETLSFPMKPKAEAPEAAALPQEELIFSFEVEGIQVRVIIHFDDGVNSTWKEETIITHIGPGIAQIIRERIRREKEAYPTVSFPSSLEVPLQIHSINTDIKLPETQAEKEAAQRHILVAQAATADALVFLEHSKIQQPSNIRYEIPTSQQQFEEPLPPGEIIVYPVQSRKETVKASFLFTLPTSGLDFPEHTFGFPIGGTTGAEYSLRSNGETKIVTANQRPVVWDLEESRNNRIMEITTVPDEVYHVLVGQIITLLITRGINAHATQEYMNHSGLLGEIIEKLQPLEEAVVHGIAYAWGRNYMTQKISSPLTVEEYDLTIATANNYPGALSMYRNLCAEGDDPAVMKKRVTQLLDLLFADPGLLARTFLEKQ